MTETHLTALIVNPHPLFPDEGEEAFSHPGEKDLPSYPGGPDLALVEDRHDEQPGGKDNPENNFNPDGDIDFSAGLLPGS